MKRDRLPGKKRNSALKKNDTPKGMRPVGARALKSAVDSLRPWLADSTVLDLFSGQGRFGVAALEEGALCVTFVEKDRSMAREISEKTLKAGERSEVVARDVFIFLSEAAKKDQKFDIIFADPPFALWTPDFERDLFAAVARVVKPGAIFLVKHPSRVVPSSAISETSSEHSHWKTSLFGESRFMYFRYGQE